MEIGENTGISKSSISIFIKSAKNENLIMEIKGEHRVKIHPTKLGKDIVLKEKLKKIMGTF